MTNLCICSIILLLFHCYPIECKKLYRISTLTKRKSFGIPLRTKFILKCSSDKPNLASETDNSIQLYQESPELIVLNDLDKIRKLIDYFEKLDDQESEIEIIGWNKTSISSLYSRGHSSVNQKLKPSDRTIDKMFKSGKIFFRPYENVNLFANGQSCLLFSSFSSKDESIYSCFYQPRIDRWSTVLSNLIKPNLLDSLMNSIGFKIDINNNDESELNTSSNDINQSNTVPILEKLLYLTCILTWPFDQDCHLVKQFKLTISSDKSVQSTVEYWDNLDAHDRLRWKKSLKQLIKHCHPAVWPIVHNVVAHDDTNSIETKKKVQSNQQKSSNEKSNKRPTVEKKHYQDHKHYQNESNWFDSLFKFLYEYLFINMICDIVSIIVNSIFDYLLGGLLGTVIYGLFSSTIGELSNEILSDLLVESLRELNLLYIIYLLFIIFLYFSFDSNEESNKQEKKRKPVHKSYKISDRFLNDSTDDDDRNVEILNEQQIDDILHKKDDTNRSTQKHDLSIRDKNLKFKIDTSITNRAGKKSLASKLKNRMNELLKRKGDRRPTGEEKKATENEQELENRVRRQRGLEDRRLSELGELKEFRPNADQPIDKHNEFDVEKAEDLKLKCEIMFRKKGKISHLSRFLVSIPQELIEDDNKPLQLILNSCDPAELNQFSNSDKISSNDIKKNSRNEEINDKPTTDMNDNISLNDEKEPTNSEIDSRNDDLLD